MSEGLFVLSGVVLGAGITGLADYVLERRRELRLTRRAARMLRLELQEAYDFIEVSLEKAQWIAEPERVLSNEVWCEHRAAFSAVRDADLWNSTSFAFLRIADVRRSNLDARAGTSLAPDDDRSEDASAHLRPITIALAKLDHFLTSSVWPITKR